MHMGNLDLVNLWCDLAALGALVVLLIVSPRSRLLLWSALRHPNSTTYLPARIPSEQRRRDPHATDL